MKRAFLIVILVIIALAFVACNGDESVSTDTSLEVSVNESTFESDLSDIISDVAKSEPDESIELSQNDESIDESKTDESIEETIPEVSFDESSTEESDNYFIYENIVDEMKEHFSVTFVLPRTDGSTSTLLLDNAIRGAIFGDIYNNTAIHTKTYNSFYNLLNGECDVIFTTPLSEFQFDIMEQQNFKHEALPIAAEGFVFVVNKDNPVDTLTIEQIKDIYSGKITNWKEVGGNDAPIDAYQRNLTSGSQNYMIEFMGDTPLMDPITDEIPGTMSGILNIIASYNNGINSIGYSVYAYSDGMYENISKIKYIKVEGVEPSFENIANGTYPLLGYNYAVFSADEPENSSVRELVNWIRSDEGQSIAANAGFAPYRNVEGLTFPEQIEKKHYYAKGNSGIAIPEKLLDYHYSVPYIKFEMLNKDLLALVETFVEDSKKELLETKDKFSNYIDAQNYYTYSGEGEGTVQTTLKNGYLSICVGYRYFEGRDGSPIYWYDFRTAVFDIYTGKKLELSELFFEEIEFVPMLNALLSSKSKEPHNSWGDYYELNYDFNGLYEGEFSFTTDSIYFKPNTCFVEGACISIDELEKYMVTSVPRDMEGLVSEKHIYRLINDYYSSRIGEAKEVPRGNESRFGNYGFWTLDKEKTTLSETAINKINDSINKIYQDFYSPEVMNKKGIWFYGSGDEDFCVFLVGNRYICFEGPNQCIYENDEDNDKLHYVFENMLGEYWFAFYYNAKTGEELKISDLFIEGWEDKTTLKTHDFQNSWQWDGGQDYNEQIDLDELSIIGISDYGISKSYSTDYQPEHCKVFLTTEDGTGIVALVPMEFIYYD